MVHGSDDAKGYITQIIVIPTQRIGTATQRTCVGDSANRHCGLTKRHSTRRKDIQLDEKQPTRRKDIQLVEKTFDSATRLEEKTFNSRKGIQLDEKQPTRRKDIQLVEKTFDSATRLEEKTFNSRKRHST